MKKKGDNNKNKLKWGERMIKLTVQFWTNNLPKGADEKTAWSSGAIHIVSMKARDIYHDHVFFKNMEEFFPKMQELLERQKVKLIEQPDKLNLVNLKNYSAK